MKKIAVMMALTSLMSACAIAPRYIRKHDIKSNSDSAKKSPYVLVISIDGYRWDYTDKYKPDFLKKFKEKAASLKSLRPSYPTKTFPNHLSIMTGRYPMNHGIVANHFYAPDLKRPYSIRDTAAVTNSDFYLSKPLWSLAEEQGMRTATYFWPGSEAKINDQRPSYYLKYNHYTEHKYRISTVAEWFKLPEDVRPHLVTLYFSDVDSAGHKFGPNSKQVEASIRKVDKSIQKLLEDIDSLNLPVNVVILSDHGMAQLSANNTEELAKDTKSQSLLEEFIIFGGGPIVHLYNKSQRKGLVAQTISILNNSAKKFKCYTQDTTPKELNFSGNSRIGDIICMAKKKWSITLHNKSIPKGNHGWSQYEEKDMHAIFYAFGPDFKESFSLDTQDNVSIYPLLAKILNLRINHKIDGKLKEMKALLK